MGWALGSGLVQQLYALSSSAVIDFDKLIKLKGGILCQKKVF